jgi:hypothetical protein
VVTAQSGHRCPGRGCDAMVPYDQLACRPHWYSLPQPIRNRIWATWHRGRGAQSQAHNDAVSEAVAYLSRDPAS